MSELNSSIFAFKEAAGRFAEVYEWHPTAHDLVEIAGRVVGSGGVTKSELQQIITDVLPGTSYVLLEGIDLSDVKQLLALAMAATKAT